MNLFALEALQNVGIDTSGFHSKSWDEFKSKEALPIQLSYELTFTEASSFTQLRALPRVDYSEELAAIALAPLDVENEASEPCERRNKQQPSKFGVNREVDGAHERNT